MLHPPSSASKPVPGAKAISGHPAELRSADEPIFLELRRKVQESQLLAAATERRLHKMKLNGRLTVVENDLGCG